MLDVSDNIGHCVYVHKSKLESKSHRHEQSMIKNPQTKSCQYKTAKIMNAERVR